MERRTYTGTGTGTGLVLAWIVLAGLGLQIGQSSPAQAQTLSEAESRFYRAQAFFEQGLLEQAAEQFLAAYEAKPLPDLLFNVGACYEKLAKESPAELTHWQRAIEYYRRYLKEAPGASDRAAIESRLAVLEGELARIEAETANPQGSEQEPVAPSPEVAALEDIGIRGLVVIESDPPGATIYLDDKRTQPLGQTPWSGTLEGEHLVYIERQGYKPLERRISPLPDKLILLAFAMSKEDYLGWVEITANIPNADIYIDDKARGVYRKTPFSGNLQPGPHKVWVTAEGYNEYFTEIEVVAGEIHEIEARLQGTPVGYLNVRGQDIQMAQIRVDGKVICERGPCRKPIPEGEHTLVVERTGYKPYRRAITIAAGTELQVNVRLAEIPGRGDAIWAYGFAAAFLGAGIYLGLETQALEDELQNEIRTGAPPPDSQDPRFLRGRVFSVGASVGYVIGSLSLAAAVYYTFRDKGPESAGTTRVESLTLTPQVTPGYAGIGMELTW